jgi:hypothetical protein
MAPISKLRKRILNSICSTLLGALISPQAACAHGLALPSFNRGGSTPVLSKVLGNRGYSNRPAANYSQQPTYSQQPVKVAPSYPTYAPAPYAKSGSACSSHKAPQYVAPTYSAPQYPLPAAPVYAQPATYTAPTTVSAVSPDSDSPAVTPPPGFTPSTSADETSEPTSPAPTFLSNAPAPSRAVRLPAPSDAEEGDEIVAAPAKVAPVSVAPVKVETVNVEPVTVEPVKVAAPQTTEKADLVLEGVEFIEPATLIAGPSYRVKFRNQGTGTATNFKLALVASLDREIAADAPRAEVEVATLAAGQTSEATIRLPRSAMRLAGPSGTAAPFTHLHVKLDAAGTIQDATPTNNVAVIEQSTLGLAVR